MIRSGTLRSRQRFEVGVELPSSKYNVVLSMDTLRLSNSGFVARGIQTRSCIRNTKSIETPIEAFLLRKSRLIMIYTVRISKSWQGRAVPPKSPYFKGSNSLLIEKSLFSSSAHSRAINLKERGRLALRRSLCLLFVGLGRPRSLVSAFGTSCLQISSIQLIRSSLDGTALG